MKVGILANKNHAYNLDTFMNLVVICYVTCSLVALGEHGTIKFVSVFGCCFFFSHVKSFCQNTYF